MLDAGDAACAMEVSSHALELRRVDGVRFAVAAFTNLSQDHLDFHPDMETYFAAKERLFREFDVGVAVVVVDDEWGRRLAADSPVPSASRSTARRTGRSRTCGRGSTGRRSPSAPRWGRPTSSCRCGDASTPRTRSWRWRAARARAVARRDGGVAAGARPVPGRVQAVDEGQDFAVLVDYAHKPGALEKVLAAAREVATGRVSWCSAQAATATRRNVPLMGEIAARMADRGDRHLGQPPLGDPDAIVAAIMAGVPAGSFHVKRAVDRREAIGAAIAHAAPGDVVVIAGKGHEQGQEFAGGRKEPFDDVAVARDALRGGGASREGLERRAGRRRGRRRPAARRRPRVRRSRAGLIDSRRSRPATCSSRSRASGSTAGASRPTRWRRARGACWRRPRGRGPLRERRRGPRRRRPRRGAGRPRPRLAPRSARR